MYWDKHGIEGICLRIGTAIEKPTEFRHLSTWLGNDDLVQLIDRCITVPDIGYLVAWGVSANTRSYWNNAGRGAARLSADAEFRGLRCGNPAQAESAGSGGAALSGWRLRHHRLHAAGTTALEWMHDTATRTTCRGAWPSGTTTSRALVEACLERIADPDGEGARAFIKVHAEQARAMADAMDMLRRAGRAPSRYAGIPVGLKDLFDIAGEPTPAGSRVLADAPPATAQCPGRAAHAGRRASSRWAAPT